MPGKKRARKTRCGCYRNSRPIQLETSRPLIEFVSEKRCSSTRDLSRDGNMSCATCHSPLFGWSDGLTTGRGFQSKVLGRASPTVVNTAYNTIQMWDGRRNTLEEQAMGP